MGAAILGLGIVCAAGSGVTEMEEAFAGRRQPAIQVESISTAQGSVSLPVYKANADGLERFMAKRALRRIDDFSRLALLASFLALEDAGLELADRTRVGIVFGSGYGPLRTTFAFQDGMIDFGDPCASPTHFANSVHNAPAAHVSMALGIEGPCQTVTCFEWTTAEVLRTAEAWLRAGAVDYVLAGVGDEYCPLAGYARAALAEGHCTCRPGEGFVVFLLGREGAAPAQYGQLRAVQTHRGGESDWAWPEPCRAILLAGDARHAPTAVRQLPPTEALRTGYGALYGDLPVALGFELAAAAVSLRAGKLYPPPGAPESGVANAPDTELLAPGDRLGCLEVIGPDGFAFVTLDKGQTNNP